MTMAITNKQREILDHTAHGAAGGFYCGDSVDMQVLVRMGLMVSMGKKSFCPDEYFALTAAGRKTLSAFNLVFSSCCKHFKAQIALQDETARLKAELAKLREIIGLVNYYFEVRAKDPQCAGEVFRDLGQKMQALKGE